MPRPKNAAHCRFTVTRAVSGFSRRNQPAREAPAGCAARPAASGRQNGGTPGSTRSVGWRNSPRWCRSVGRGLLGGRSLHHQRGRQGASDLAASVSISLRAAASSGATREEVRRRWICLAVRFAVSRARSSGCSISAGIARVGSALRVVVTEMRKSPQPGGVVPLEEQLDRQDSAGVVSGSAQTEDGLVRPPCPPSIDPAGLRVAVDRRGRR